MDPKAIDLALNRFQWTLEVVHRFVALASLETHGLSPAIVFFQSVRSWKLR